MAPAISLYVQNADAVIANLYSAVSGIKQVAKQANIETAEFVKQRTFGLAAFRTGFLRDNIRARISAQGYAFTVGWEASDFTSAGLEFYPPFVEFGTSKMPGQPALIPAFQDGVAFLKARLGTAIRAEIQRRSRGTD